MKQEKIQLKTRVGVVLSGIGVIFPVLVFPLSFFPFLPVNVMRAMMMAAFSASILLPALMYLIRFIRRKRTEKADYIKKQEAYYALRENWEKSKKRLSRRLRLIRVVTNLYAVILMLCSIILSFIMTKLMFVQLILAEALLCTAFTQLRLSLGGFRDDFERKELETYNYPLLYELAGRAARETGFRKRVRISIRESRNVSISRIRGGILLEIDPLYLNLFTEDELYAVLLHELTHLKERGHWREYRYINRMWLLRQDCAYDWFAKFMYKPLDERFREVFDLWHYASGLNSEFLADAGMKSAGVENAASALTKLFFAGRYYFEQMGRDMPNHFEKTDPDRTYAEKELTELKSAIVDRGTFWKMLIDKEIISRTTTHPTLKMRLERLGAGVTGKEPRYSKGSFGEECLKILRMYEEFHWYRIRVSGGYHEYRKQYYISHAMPVAEWEKDGCPVTVENFSDMADHLEALGQRTRLMELCGTAIEKFPEALTGKARYMRGICRLSRYDDGGIGDLYEAIRFEPRCADKALEAIGDYCCMMGLKEELDSYRDKGVLLAKEYAEGASRAGDLQRKEKKNLNCGNLPDDLRDVILERLAAEDPREIVEKAYVVRQKLTKDLNADIMILRFRQMIPAELQSKLMHNMTVFLNTFENRIFVLRDEADIDKRVMRRIRRIKGALILQVIFDKKPKRSR